MGSEGKRASERSGKRRETENGMTNKYKCEQPDGGTEIHSKDYSHPKVFKGRRRGGLGKLLSVVTNMIS